MKNNMHEMEAQVLEHIEKISSIVSQLIGRAREIGKFTRDLQVRLKITNEKQINNLWNHPEMIPLLKEHRHIIFILRSIDAEFKDKILHNTNHKTLFRVSNLERYIDYEDLEEEE